jgi:hypothetical protein
MFRVTRDRVCRPVRNKPRNGKTTMARLSVFNVTMAESISVAPFKNLSRIDEFNYTFVMFGAQLSYNDCLWRWFYAAFKSPRDLLRTFLQILPK